MNYPVDLNQRLHLAGELRSRQRQFDEGMVSLLALARDPARPPGALVEMRYQLGRMIRLRRAAIEEVLSLPADGPEARAIAAEARDIKDRMHAAHLAQLGFWPAARMEAEPERLAESFAPRLPSLLAFARAESEAAERYLDRVSPPELMPAWLEVAAR